MALLARLDIAWIEDRNMPDFLIKEYFVRGLFKTLREKVDCESPRNFNETIHVARKKFRKMMYKLHKVDVVIERLPSHRRYENIGIYFDSFPKGITCGSKIEDSHPRIEPLPAQNPTKCYHHHLKWRKKKSSRRYFQKRLMWVHSKKLASKKKEEFKE